MEAENPYQPPQSDELEDIASRNNTERRACDTRWQASQAGIQRGVIKGLKVSAVLTGCWIVAILVLAIIMHVSRANIIDRSIAEILFYFIRDFFQMLGASLAGCIFLAFAFAIIGGAIMGLIEMIRFRKPK
ncbi:MAG: hypothetical protein U9N87_09110 [Planctomycetota bacterium]|nr:hypothetical protein [Planctomycetota bacterium]